MRHLPALLTIGLLTVSGCEGPPARKDRKASRDQLVPQALLARQEHSIART
jgi:hypothetical protein